jgi:hypothetical protein
MMNGYKTFALIAGSLALLAGLTLHGFGAF